MLLDQRALCGQSQVALSGVWICFCYEWVSRHSKSRLCLCLLGLPDPGFVRAGTKLRVLKVWNTSNSERMIWDLSNTLLEAQYIAQQELVSSHKLPLVYTLSNGGGKSLNSFSLFTQCNLLLCSVIPFATVCDVANYIANTIWIWIMPIWLWMRCKLESE